MKKASIDLGTNTCLLLIAEVELQSGHQAATKLIEDHSTIVRLGKGVDQSRLLDSAAMERTLECLKKYSTRVKAQGLDPKDTVAVATATARDAKNGKEFFERVKTQTGFSFRTLTGDQEAQFTFLGGLLPGLEADKCVVIDIGGGSTELMSLKGGESLDMGSVRFTERYLKSNPVQDSEFWECEAAIDQMLDPLLAGPIGQIVSGENGKSLIAVAGTATTLAAWFLELPQFNAAKIDQVTLTRGDVHRMVEELKWRTHEERAALTGIEAGRADVLLAGALILWRVMEKMNFKECRISTRGLRYGVLSL